MRHSDRLKGTPGTFRPLTGLTPAAFDPLLTSLTPRYDQADARRKGRPDRRRKPGAGRKHVLSLADRLLMLLIYYRTYVSHAFLGFLFGLDDSAVGRNINPLQPLLAGISRIPERLVELQPDELRELFFDATERPTRRPRRRQRRCYSGKKKRHTLKSQVVVVRKRKRAGRRKQKRRLRIAAVSPTGPGRVPDKKVYDRARVIIPPGVAGYGDTGYRGTDLRTPVKRKPKQTLTRRRRRGNRRHSRQRIAAGHGIGEMKIWRIAGERYRNPARRPTLIRKNVAGLHNLMFS